MCIQEMTTPIGNDLKKEKKFNDKVMKPSDYKAKKNADKLKFRGKRKKKMNKKGGMADLFIFMIVAVIVIFISVMFVYMGGLAKNKLHETMDNMTIGGNENVSQVIDQTFGRVDQAYQSLYWISVMLIIGMILSIFIGSYLVTTKPIFFIPYIFILIIAVIVSVGISNAYEQVMEDPTLAGTFAGFIGANYIMLQLPIWIAIIGIVGAIIMFVRMGSKDNQIYGGGSIYG